MAIGMPCQDRHGLLLRQGSEHVPFALLRQGSGHVPPPCPTRSLPRLPYTVHAPVPIPIPLLATQPQTGGHSNFNPRPPPPPPSPRSPCTCVHLPAPYFAGTTACPSPQNGIAKASGVHARPSGHGCTSWSRKKSSSPPSQGHRLKPPLPRRRTPRPHPRPGPPLPSRRRRCVSRTG